MADQPTVTIEQWFVEGWRLYKRNPITFFFASFLGALICIPPAILFFAGPLYAGLYYMALKGMRGEKPRIRDMFRGFRRYWAALFLWWLSLITFVVLGTTAIGILVTPLLWAITTLAFPLLIDEQKSVGSAFGAAFKVVFTWKNAARFWLYGLLVPTCLIPRYFGVLLRCVYHTSGCCLCPSHCLSRPVQAGGGFPTRDVPTLAGISLQTQSQIY